MSTFRIFWSMGNGLDNLYLLTIDPRRKDTHRPLLARNRNTGEYSLIATKRDSTGHYIKPLHMTDRGTASCGSWVLEPRERWELIGRVTEWSKPAPLKSGEENGLKFYL